jgi:hypothetical protein
MIMAAWFAALIAEFDRSYDQAARCAPLKISRTD